jgi:uncharacterized protein DUF3644
MLACDLYNQRRRERNLQAFIVHMSIAWLSLFQAICIRDDVDFYYRRGRRIERIDGEAKTWDLAKCVANLIPDERNPTRANIEFFLKLRNKIEHRFTERQLASLETLVAGKVQAYFLNFERALVKEFGKAYSLGESLRFPIFLSSLTEDAVDAIKRIYAEAPRKTKAFIDTFEASMDVATLSHPAYDFRIYLIQKLSSKSKADLAVEFIPKSKLSGAGLKVIEQATVVSKEVHVEIANLNRMRTGEVVEKVRAAYPDFNMYHHQLAWTHFGVRPHSNASDPTRTDARYCVYDRAHRDYTYLEAWVEKLRGALRTDAKSVITSWKPRPA